MELSGEALAEVYASIASMESGEKSCLESVNKNMGYFDFESYRTHYFESISLAHALSVVLDTITRDPEFRLPGIELDGLRSFFITSFLYIMPQKYHNLDHSINTLCFGSFVLHVLGKTYRTCAWDRLCFMLALSLHDIGHPGEYNRGRLGSLTFFYESNKPPTFEVIHVAIFRRIALDYKSVLFRELNIEEMNERLGFVEKIIFATDMRSNKQVMDEFDSKYLEITNEDGVLKKRLRENVSTEICEIEFKMAVKLSDLSSCYKDYNIFNTNSLAFWSEVHDGCGGSRRLEDTLQDIHFLENISIPLAESFSLVFGEFKPFFDQAVINLKLHKEYYEVLTSSMSDENRLDRK